MAWSWFSNTSTNESLPIVFPLGVDQTKFVTIDVQNIFSKILTDVIERTHGLSDDEKDTLWDSCVKTQNTQGLITMISEAMAEQKSLYLVYEKPPVNVVRKATDDEKRQIIDDYKKSAKSNVGIYISFEKFDKILLIKIYSALTYCVAGALNKGLNISMALQIAIKNLRTSVGLADIEVAKTQAKEMATSLQKGNAVLMDVEDAIRNSMPALDSVEKAMKFIDQKMSFYLGLPASYVMGEQTSGISSTGEADTKAIERGLKNYYESIIKPVAKDLFEKKTSYKSQDFRQIDQALEALKTFELVGESYIGPHSKKKIIQTLLDLDQEDIKKDEKLVAELEAKAKLEAKNNPPPVVDPNKKPIEPKPE